MRSKQVWRYYCEFCGKSNCSAGSITKHEKHCTANPNRECRICKRGGEQRPIAELIATLGGTCTDANGDLHYSIAALREAASSCPACMLAAIRQCGLQTLELDAEGNRSNPTFDFNFKQEIAEFWAEENDAEHERDMRACHGEF